MSRPRTAAHPLPGGIDPPTGYVDPHRARLPFRTGAEDVAEEPTDKGAADLPSERSVSAAPLRSDGRAAETDEEEIADE